MKNKNTIIAILSTIIVVFVILLIIGLTSKDEQVVAPTQTYKEIAKEEFMSECASDGLYLYCDCAFEKLYSNLGGSGLIDLRIEFDETGVMPEEALDMITSCFALVE